ncbi:HAD family hydrolase [Halorubrum sp. DTA46]|uniref:HAD family hydrolase n=1 Tax=Halorubrum sp. DTA46 TaxID=3402162 RepID=UPI003AACDEC3
MSDSNDSGGATPAPADPTATDGGVPDPAAYDAVVYDLDGTLVELVVDWEAVAESVLGVYTDHAVKPPTSDLWGLLESADDYGIGQPVEEAIALHERSGARDSTILPLGERLIAASTRAAENESASGRPSVGVCSLNCEEACRIAVETHGLDAAIDGDAVVGRDTVESHKPEPESLLAAIDRLGASPEHALFVGDSERDAVAAERAGVDYAWASELLGR